MVCNVDFKYLRQCYACAIMHTYTYIRRAIMMQRTTIMLPEELKLKAIQKANKQGVSLGELIRAALMQLCAKNDKYHDPLFDENNVYDGDLPDDISLNHDDYLY